MEFSQRIIKTLEEIAKVRVPGARQEKDRKLGLIYVYQVIEKWSNRLLKDTLKEYLKDNNISSNHNDYEVGKKIVSEGNRFILLYEVSNPRSTFSKEHLKLFLMRDYNISEAECQELFDKSTIPGVKAITKTVILKD